MVRTSIVALVTSAFVITAAEPCSGGQCTEWSAESTAILQSKRALNKLTRQTTQSSTQLSQLLQAATQLLKSGATPDVMRFTEDTLTDLRNDILPAIAAAHSSDVQRLADTVGNFNPIESKYEEHKQSMSSLRSAVHTARDKHNECRSEQGTHCQAADACETERQRLEDILVQERQQYKTTMDRIGTQYCVDEHDHTSTEFREHSASNFDSYMKEGREMIEARKAHDLQHRKCEELKEVLTKSKEECDEDKKELERASCTVHHEHVLGLDDLNTAWQLAAENLETTKEEVETLQQHRVAELKGLKQIECILEKLYERGGKACDTDTNEADQIAAECAAAGDDTSSLVISYPDAPEKPEAEAEDPHPCDSSFLSFQYGHWTDTCFHDMVECTPCVAEALR